MQLRGHDDTAHRPAERGGLGPTEWKTRSERTDPTWRISVAEPVSDTTALGVPVINISDGNGDFGDTNYAATSVRRLSGNTAQGLMVPKASGPPGFS